METKEPTPETDADLSPAWEYCGNTLVSNAGTCSRMEIERNRERLKVAKLVKALEDLVNVLPDPRESRVFDAKQAARKALNEAKP